MLPGFFIMRQKNKGVETYLGNKNLKAVGVVMNYTQHQFDEYNRCAADPIYFIKKYVKIVHVDKGVVNFALYPFQERIINAYKNNRKVICKIGRQQGKTQTTAAFFLWTILFQDNKLVAVMANKAAVAREILSRIQFAYENLPFWLQQGVKEWNKGSIDLENGSGIITAATSPNAIRGFAASIVYIDETAFIPPNIAEEFFTSVFPTISSGKETKIFLSSTPKGMNHFYKLWLEAEQGINGFFTVSAEWYDNPTRDQDWADEQLKTLGKIKYNQEVLCVFSGSSRTLIEGEKVAALPMIQNIFEKDNLKIYDEPVKGHSYVCVVDTSRGQHIDYSAFVIIDITKLPYEVVATYKDNTISPMAYPFLIMEVCKKYNNAYTLIEINDLGEQVSSTLFYEFEYEQVYFTYKDELNEGRGYPGVRTTKKVKSIGCSALKNLIEGDQLLVKSIDIIQELAVFVQKGASYSTEQEAANGGVNDDLTICLVLFAWLTKQPLFADLTNVNIRGILAKKVEEHIAENIIPFGFSSTVDDEEVDGFHDVRTNYSSSLDAAMDKWMFS
jgi:hypothetical protein